jgi:hypothetical protein
MHVSQTPTVETHLQSLLYPEPPQLLHEQEDAVAPRSNVVPDLRQLHLREVLRGQPAGIVRCLT